MKSFTYYNFPCGRFDDVSIIDINKTIENEIKIFKPNTIITHNADDCNNDHRIVYRSVMMSTRPMQKNNFLKQLLHLKQFQALNGILINNFHQIILKY